MAVLSGYSAVVFPRSRHCSNQRPHFCPLKRTCTTPSVPLRHGHKTHNQSLCISPSMCKSRVVMLMGGKTISIWVKKGELGAAANFYGSAFKALRLNITKDNVEMQLREYRLVISEYNNMTKPPSCNPLRFENGEAVIARAISMGAVTVGDRGMIVDPFGCFWLIEDQGGLGVSIWRRTEGFFLGLFSILTFFGAPLLVVVISMYCLSWLFPKHAKYAETEPSFGVLKLIQQGLKDLLFYPFKSFSDLLVEVVWKKK